MPPRTTWLYIACAAALVLAGCSSHRRNGDAGDAGDGGQGASDGGEVTVDGGEVTVDGGTDASDAGSGSPEDGGSAFPLADAPQVVDEGGPVLTRPQLVPLYPANGDAGDEAHLEEFLGKLAGSAYWQTTTGEYGVGAVRKLAAIESDDETTGEYLDSSFIDWVQSNVQWSVPPDGGDLVYVVLLPAAASLLVTMPDDTQVDACDLGRGAHAQVDLGLGGEASFVVIPTCPPGTLSTQDQQTAALVRELVEATTDPYAEDEAAYDRIDDAHLYFDDVYAGSEVSDLCDSVAVPTLAFPGLGVVPRVWSNRSVAAGHDPCVPATDGEVFFNTIPDFTQDVTYLWHFEQRTVKGVNVGLGGTVTIPLDLYSDEPTGDWNVSVEDEATYWQTGEVPELSFSLDRTSGHDGDQLQITIHRRADGEGGPHLFFIRSVLGNEEHDWPGVVGD